MITTNIISRVFHISIENDMGSSFSVEYKGEQYLVSAKHVLESIDFENGDSITVQIYHNHEWKNLVCEAYSHENDEIDIVVLRTKQVKFGMLPVKFGIEGIHIGQDLYFLGFPYGKYSKGNGIESISKFPIPFVKKGILSAVEFDENIFSLYIDAHNNIGFSGGPIITVNPKGEVQIVGVNVSYLKHYNTLNYEEQDDEGELYDEEFRYYENSGIMEGHSIQHVFEIIDSCISN